MATITTNVASAVVIAHDIASTAQATLACPEPGCPRQFVRKFSLLEHIKTHSSEGQHVCPVRTCGKTFSTSGNLSRHKRLHGYIEPLPCPVDGCVCAFPSNKKLQKHMKFHFSADVKPCTVPGCGKAFSTTGNLNRHLKNHHGLADVDCQSPRASSYAAKTSSASHAGAESPTSAEQWTHGVSSGAVDDCDDLLLWSSTCFVPTDIDLTTGSMFDGADDEVWTPELLDTLVNLLGDDSATEGVGAAADVLPLPTL